MNRQGNLHFNAGEFNESVLAFETASIINPTDATYYTNAAAARLKLGTSHQYVFGFHPRLI
jgi:Flp pilus assembly protein TadD